MNKLYTYRELTFSDDKLSALIMIDASHNIFQGHFPEKPLLPGVCMIQMMIDAMSIHLKKEVTLQSGSMIKFINMWLPEVDQHADLSVAFQLEENNTIRIKNCVIGMADRPFFKFKGSLHA